MTPAPVAEPVSILVIDDEAANTDLLARFLAREGYADVRSLNDPRTALDQFIARPPDLILLDLMMPHLDGFSLLEAFRRQTLADEFRPTIVLTADVSVEARRRALSLGARDYITKPLDLVEVGLRVANMAEMIALHRRLAARAG